MERKEAIEVVKKNWPDSSFTMLREALETLIPELKESEDERIRNGLIGYFRAGKCENISSYHGISTNDILAWLEKQGKNNMGISEATKQKLEDSLNKALEKETSESCNEFLNGQKPADKIEPKFKVGDKVYALRNRFECIIESMDETTYYGDTTNFDIKDQDDWKLVEQKSSWSKEDEEMHRKCICAMRASACGFPEEEKFVEQVNNWLKSLRPKNTWKPSDEQMEALKEAVDEHFNIDGGALWHLYEDLKKLREE